ncbi:hypothetical protein Kpol_449p4 [Vanderwaltozyma polyspora DSM 70294]|uniref:NADP-dependent oxidoreductase domain-containing protein n=1 Tax=Vanderwaltozyma polyspora (strain ATCC 22028 / DSM 70294 / BCRC 21397 / CBS 2163 / NBRC 10782 / NRRL Y-8283 / UCD 57-17) TaxID=436907 RepID=A7TR14_VANPO|nr:uncharacterized protein Kpol_449p4 [Vanderwaltozyma polyspora DSM 70294]EDO15289.1 hypothetical protein Kpol_449p4 [Vanderwaltozyma polyspora DSM 70294]
MSIVQQKKFGNTGLKVSPLIIGCMSFGSKTWDEWVQDDKEEAFKILKHAYDRGIRSYDTANVYSNGQSEIILGEFLRKYNIPRETVVIMTKLRFPADENMDIDFKNMTPEMKLNVVNMQGLSRKSIFSSSRASVKRLGTYIDILQIHRGDPDTPFEETMGALNDVVIEGLTRYVGASLMLATEFAEMQFVAEKHGWFKFVNSQSCYHLMYREDERELIPFAKRHNIALTPFSPLNRGLLCRPLGTETTRSNSDSVIKTKNLKNYTDWEASIINRVEKLSIKKNIPMSAISLAWVLQKGCFPIVGFSSIERVEEAIDALDVNLTEEEMKYLEEPYQHRELYT